MITAEVKTPKAVTAEVLRYGAGGGAVKSVNGYTGDVVLGADDIKFSDGKTFQQKFNDGDMQGAKGDNGVSPTADVTQGVGEAIITITDSKGTTTATLKDGTNGKDGTSPTASVKQDSDGATVTVIDANGTTTAKLTNGVNGDTGFSPTITEKTSTPTEYTLEITNETGSYITPNLKGSDGQGAVDSVNGYSGNVTLKAKDIETEAGDTIEVALESAGKVKSVNTLTGEVVLKAENINTNSGETIETALANAKYDDTQVKADIKSNSDRITALENLPNANEVKY